MSIVVTMVTASPKCSAEEFTCQDGTCIPVTSHCDAFPDCPDSSDENPVICGQHRVFNLFKSTLGHYIRYVGLSEN